MFVRSSCVSSLSSVDINSFLDMSAPVLLRASSRLQATVIRRAHGPGAAAPSSFSREEFCETSQFSEGSGSPLPCSSSTDPAVGSQRTDYIPKATRR